MQTHLAHHRLARPRSDQLVRQPLRLVLCVDSRPLRLHALLVQHPQLPPQLINLRLQLLHPSVLQDQLRLQSFDKFCLLLVLPLQYPFHLLHLPTVRFIRLVLLCFLLEFVIQSQRLLSEEDNLLLEEDSAFVGHDLFLLLVTALFDHHQFLLHGLDVVAVGQQELGLVCTDHLLDLCVHLANRFYQVLVHLVGLSQCRQLPKVMRLVGVGTVHEK